ncbi:MAG: glycosyltransferase family 39 protein [Chloroflexi bacterium]|nr:glycosyltransferase family 39 protein [Chloroflexota bacterium]
MNHLRTFWHSQVAFLLLLTLLALALRVGYAFVYLGAGYSPELDAREYSDIAASLASGRGFALADGALTAIRPPLFPLLLAAVYRLAGGVNYAAGLALEALLGTGVVLATYAAADRVYGRRTGRLAGLMAAIYPLLIYAGGALLSEPLFILLVMLALAAGLTALDRPTPGNHALLGLWLGLAWLARPNGLLLVIFLLGWLVVARLQGRGDPAPAVDAKGTQMNAGGRRFLAGGKSALIRVDLRPLLLAALAALAVVSPWIIRNYHVFGKLIPSTTMGGAVLFGSNNARVLAEPALHGDWVAPCEIPGAGWSCALDEVGRDAAWQQLGVQFIREHLSDLPRLVWWRIVKFWHLYPFTHGFPENVGFYAYVAAALLAGAGAWLTRQQWRRTGAALAVIACFAAGALLFWGGFRMRTPAEPALIVLAAGAVARVLRINDVSC